MKRFKLYKKTERSFIIKASDICGRELFEWGYGYLIHCTGSGSNYYGWGGMEDVLLRRKKIRLYFHISDDIKAFNLLRNVVL